MATPIVGTLKVHQEPYPHLRDDSGTVLARDYEDERKTSYIVRAVNSHEALVEALTAFVAEAELGANILPSEQRRLKMGREALAAAEASA